MAIRIDERFQVDAPVDAVWDFLVDPRRVVACVPGGELLGVADDGTFDGRVRVAVGPLTFAYGGRVRLAEVDLPARHVRIVGQARERTGPDMARLTLESRLLAVPRDRTEVVAVARVDAEGRIMALGKGVLEPLAHVVFQDFAAAVCAAVEAEVAAEMAAGRSRRPPARRADHAAAAPPGPPLRAVPLVLRTLRGWMASWLRPRAR